MVQYRSLLIHGTTLGAQTGACYVIKLQIASTVDMLAPPVNSPTKYLMNFSAYLKLMGSPMRHFKQLVKPFCAVLLLILLLCHRSFDDNSSHSVLFLMSVLKQINYLFQVNGATSWIDGSFVYGPSSLWSDSLRMFEGGLFNLSDRGLPPLNTKGLPLDNYPPPRTHKLTKPADFWGECKILFLS